MKTYKTERYLGTKYKIPKTAKYIFYRNPEECSYLEVERINPNHRMVIWGILRSKYRKYKPVNKIKIGRIIVPMLILGIQLGYYDLLLTYIIYNLIMGLILCNMIIILPCLGLKPTLRTYGRFVLSLLA